MEWWLTLCLIALSTLLALWFSGCRSKSMKHLPPPGPWTLPVIGSLHHILSAFPHRALTDLGRRHGPVMLLKLGEVPLVVISSAEAVAQVFKANDVALSNHSSSRLQDIVGFGGKGILFAPYGEHWRQMRKVCITELLSTKQVKRMEGIRAEEVGNLIRSINTATAAGATVNVSEMVSVLSNDIVTRAVFGGKFARQEEYLHEIGKLMDLIGGFCLVDLFPSSWLVQWFSTAERRTKRSCDLIQSIIADIFEKRKAARASRHGAYSDDEEMLNVLLRLLEEDSLAYPLTTEIIVTVMFDMFGGATETTATTLVWAMSELIRHPNVLAKAHLEVREVLGEGRAIIGNSDLAELHYLRMVIKEVLRLHAPGPLIPRRTRENCNIMGYDVPKDTNVFINVFATHRDSQYWDNPEEFNPERFVNKNIDYNGTYFEFTPFGGGRRKCPGVGFALSILEITLANFLYHFNWTLPGGASSVSLDMSEKFGVTVRKRSDLWLKAIPHVCSKATHI
ncbi:zealexin A1 synthase-like [Aegilops tauschii subsp. strangulata]|uniref:Cytochrome P450 71D7 n=1 Tax=Aegilops tauschii subsp. strangulata TaxID=200361 RepID=A0A453AAB5_AEGTS|nr:zealexin A1 synthase-like [Aegilops tauschii subsp. strangulata]